VLTVVTANQALLWAALRVADGHSGSVSDYGRLGPQGYAVGASGAFRTVSEARL